MTVDPETAPEIGQFFNDAYLAEGKEHRDIRTRELPYLTRPLIEAIHEVQPDTVIAADRGGRPVALAVMRGWRHRYPGERFPTIDNAIHFARISSRSVSARDILPMMRRSLYGSGVLLDKDEEELFDADAKIALLDDWAVDGNAFRRFKEGAIELGFLQENIFFMTLAGQPIDENHVIGDPRRRATHAQWEDDFGKAVGVSFETSATLPAITKNDSAVQLRKDVRKSNEQYYKKFVAAVKSGQITTKASLL
jgi:hypothetical protein